MMNAAGRVAILGGVRIPFARQNTNYAAASNLDMLTATLKGVVERFGLEGRRLGEVAAGAVLKHTRDFNLTRDASLASGLAPETPAYDVQQACATSLESAILVGNKIAMDQIEVGIAGGVDSASDAPVAISEQLRRLVLGLNRAKGSLARLRVLSRLRPSMLIPSVPNVNERRTGLSMGEHCEQMVRHWHISRAAQDELALASHTRGLQAYANGFYQGLVIPYLGLTRDNNLRADASLEKLARLPPVFDRTSGLGTLTAGNSTPLTDGAAAVSLSSERWTLANHQTPEAWFVDAETAAVDYFGPSAEGLLMAPAYAVPRLLDRNGLTLQDFDYYQIHEAFTGQVLSIRAFIEDRLQAGKKPATIKRSVATIARAHTAAGLLNPCSSEAVRLGLKKMGRETSARQDQAHPLGWKDIKEFIESAGEGLRADRERALPCMAYETLARRSELVALEVRDLDLHPDGTGQALIRRGKTDAEGQGRMAYLSRETVRWLKVWLENAQITEGAVFRRLIGRDRIGGLLNAGSIAPIFKRVAQWVGMPARMVKHVSGHSTRVGATQDLAALDIDLAAITQAGGWKSTRMPLQYAEKIVASRSGMARAAAAAGRDAIGERVIADVDR